MRTKRNMPENPMSGLARTLALLAAAAVAGCAAAAPGYMPPAAEKPSHKQPLALTKAFESGKVGTGGVYTVSEAERALDCRKLTGSMQIIMRRLDDASNRPVQSGTSKTIQALAAPVTHGSAPLTVSEEVAREKARLKAYNQLLAEKKCTQLDIARYQ